MKLEIIVQLNKEFEGSARVENGELTEEATCRKFRQIQSLWQSIMLKPTRKRASGLKTQNLRDRFAGVSKMIDLGLGSPRSAEDMKLMWVTEK